jgi:hypothetical protein
MKTVCLMAFLVLVTGCMCCCGGSDTVKTQQGIRPIVNTTEWDIDRQTLHCMELSEEVHKKCMNASDLQECLEKEEAKVLECYGIVRQMIDEEDYWYFDYYDIPPNHRG